MCAKRQRLVVGLFEVGVLQKADWRGSTFSAAICCLFPTEVFSLTLMSIL
jgi:hypothetical protein